MDPLKEAELKSLIEKIQQQAYDGIFDKFIHYAVFPNFKNLEPKSRINFHFPLTVVVGPNGTGKSSILHALYGMPDGYTTGRFWFSTNLDAIQEGAELGQHRYFYGHSLNGKVVETRKARVTNLRRGANYWEPTKASVTDGMQKVDSEGSSSEGRTKSRWNPVKREVLFLNFKSELSAYDKYMYFGREPKLATIKTKQQYITRDSRILRKIVDANSQTYPYFGRNVVDTNRLLTKDELKEVSAILGRDYAEARIIKHRLFGGDKPTDGLSVIFKNKDLSYSEAHAGSGEVAVVSAVMQILALPKYSLILLDEPEVSLHPAAQRHLLIFLLTEIKRKQHQIVLSTHSPELIRGLPSDSVKLMISPPEGRFQIVENVSPTLAFYTLGTPAIEKLTIYVEDEMAAILVKQAISTLQKGEKNSIDVRPYGGAEAILSTAVPILMNQSAKVVIFLDGDKKPSEVVPDPITVPEADNSKFDDIIKKAVKCKPHLNYSGNSGDANIAEKAKAQRKYLSWYRKNVHFLPLTCPDHIILNSIRRANNQTELITNDAKTAKTELLNALNIKIEDIENADEVHTMAKYKLKEVAPHVTELSEILKVIQPLIHKLNSG